ncbi:hypothetical protein [Actinoplanes sp. NPDC051494]|uniref:hypothetical protein n=1 Tax=Actinoplanes sp. NPDC051494 TaxID=3363907 RepID=UPI003798EDEF
MDLVALVGNGLSIACEPRFSCSSLTIGMQEKFKNLGLDGADTALRKFAEKLNNSRSIDNAFEEMLGPLEAASGVLGGLYEMASALRSSMPGNGDKILESLRRAERFSDLFYRLGSTGILELIEEVSEGVDISIPKALVEGLVEVAAPGKLTIGTLNYDALLLSAVLAIDEERRTAGDLHFAADMADGRVEMFHEVTPRKEIRGHRIRRSISDFPSWPLTLLALHGSLTWLRDTRSGDVWKFELSDIRSNPNYWNDILQSSDWKPAVIMTNQSGKASRVTEQPFKLAYEAFQERLGGASRWMIGGYGFGDECVNSVLAEVAAKRHGVNCLVVTHAGSPTRDKVEEVLRGVSSCHIYDGDLKDLLRADEWREWRR